jgi:glucan phosphoethanolaminetransferase (alkaline phosphatase superfamily)
MIQRVQTIYIFLAMLCIGATCTGVEFFRFVHSDSAFSFNVFGITSIINGATTEIYKSIPIYLSVIGMCLFMFMTLMSYKKIERQLKWVRSLTFLYFIIVIASMVYFYIGGKVFFKGEFTMELGLGYALLVAGLPFCFLAQLGIKKDKKLLDSLNRLR